MTMLPNNSTEATPQAPSGGQETPTSAPSSAQAEPLPEYVTALQNQIAELTKAFRTTQGSADAQISQIRGDIKRILELKDQGLNESQIQRELWIDQQMNGKNQSAPVQQPVGNEPKNTGIDVEATIKSFQFPENDPGLAALRVKFSGRPQELLNAAAELRLSQVSTPNPSGATGLSPTGGTTSGGQVDQKALWAEYQQAVAPHRGNILKVSEIQADYRRRGLNV